MRWRKALRFWHRWFGLGAAVWLFLLAATGSAIVFYDEIDRWLNPDWRTAPAGAAAPVSKAAQAMPGFAPRFIDLPNRPGDTILMLGERGGRDLQVFADPRDGAVLGWRESGVMAFDRRHLLDTLYGLHMDLMLGETMAWFLGLVALFWSLDHIAGALLALPRFSSWRTAFLVKGRGMNLRRLFDLHRASGLWLFPVTLSLAVTGWTLTWHEESRALVRLVAPVSERLHYDFPERPATRDIGLDAALAIAVRNTGSPADSVMLLPHEGVYGVRSFDPRDLDGMGRLWTYVAMEGGRIVGQRHDNGQGPGDAFFAWQYPVHSGKAFGLAGRLAVLAGGIATMALCVTGLWLWLRRR